MAGTRAYEIRWTASAGRDLRDIAAYIGRDSPSSAESVRARLTRAIEALERQPTLGRVVPELHEVGIDSWRELIVRPYRVLYRIDAGRIIISLVCDSRRDFQDVLLERLTGYEP